MAITGAWNNTNRVYSTNFVGQILKPLVVIGDSDQTAQPKFKYRVTVKLNNVEVFRGLYPPNDAAVVLADISNIIESECGPEIISSGADIHRRNAGFYANVGQGVKWVDVKITEYYATSASTTPSGNDDVDLTGLVIRSNNLWNEQDGIDLADFKLNNAANGFLTDMPTTIYMSRDEDLTVSYVNDSTTFDPSTGATRIRFEYSTGTSQDAVNGSLTPTTPSLANRANFILHANVGAANIERSSLSIPSNAIYYHFYATTGTTRQSKKYRVHLVEYCAPVYRLMFVNRYGMMDFFTFEEGYQITDNFTRQKFEKTPGNWTGSTYSYRTTDRGRGQTVTDRMRRIKVNSRWLTEEESTWLGQLVYSPDVYWIDGDNVYPVTIIDSNYETKTDRYNGNFNLSLTFELSNDLW